ncbi:MAG: hypothetical protein E6H76_15290, partial [Betaproteobacteria bacterium]
MPEGGGTIDSSRRAECKAGVRSRRRRSAAEHGPRRLRRNGRPGARRSGDDHSAPRRVLGTLVVANSFAQNGRAGTRAARAPSSTKVVRSRGGKHLRIDIHCHYLNQAVAAKVAPLNPAQYEPSVEFANALTREVNVKQMRDRGPKLSTIETRLKDMDRMGIDLQAISPAPNQTYYWTEPELGAELSRLVNDRLAEIVATWPDRFVALGTVPLQNVDLALAELE